MDIATIVRDLQQNNPLSKKELEELSNKAVESANKLNRELNEKSYLDPSKLLDPITPNNYP